MFRLISSRFQYVSCQFDNLRQHKGRKKIQEALRDLPKGLDATYDRMLNNIAPEYQQGVASVLKWLAFSLRPLLVDELAEAFILDPEKPVTFEEDEKLFNLEDVLSYLAGFVVKVPTIVGTYFDTHEQSRFTSRTNVFQIRFAHFSIKEYLCSTRMGLKCFSTAEELSHLYLAKSCLAYHLQLSKNTLATEETISRYVLWDYVARNWTRHLEMIDRQGWTDDLAGDAKYALSVGSQSLLSMIQTSDPDNKKQAYWETTVDSLASPIYYTAALGLCQLTKLLIDAGADVNGISPKTSGTALYVAASEGHKDVIILLLENHADVNQISRTGASALQAAAFDENIEIVQLLLEYGADINDQGGHDGNALQAAAYCGSIESGWYGKELQAAAFEGKKEIVQLLIDHGAKVDAQGGYFGNALQAAASKGDKEVVQLLVDHGAEINAQGGMFGNALQASIISDKVEIAEILLSLGAKGYEPGEACEALLLQIERTEYGSERVDRLRKFQEGPKGYIARRKEEIPREWAERKRQWAEERADREKRSAEIS